MRVYSVVVVIVTALLAVTNAQLASKQTDQVLISSDSHLESRTIPSEDHAVQTRLLRSNEDANEGDLEERRLVNVDLAIQDAVHVLRKNTKWKLQFAAWKTLHIEPFTLARNWGIVKKGLAMWQHPKWEKLMAYVKYYGKGPLKYS